MGVGGQKVVALILTIEKVLDIYVIVSQLPYFLYTLTSPLDFFWDFMKGIQDFFKFLFSCWYLLVNTFFEVISDMLTLLNDLKNI